MKTFIVGCVLAISAVAGLSSNAHAWWTWEEYRKNINTSIDIATSNSNSVSEIIAQTPSSGGDNISKALAHTANIIGAANTINENCEGITHNVSELRSCQNTYVSVVSLAAECSLQIAAYASTSNRPDMAKKIYRTVITLYTGPAYRSYVKKAEFALEDLKGN